MKLIRETIHVSILILLVSCGNKSNFIEYVLDGKRITAKISDNQIKEKYASGKIKILKFEHSTNSEYYIELYENGIKKEEGLLIDKLKEGLWRYYYSSGVPNTHITYKHDKVNGRVFEIDSLGGVRFVGNQKMGIHDGFTTFFYEDGTIRKQGRYKNGTPIGNWIRNE